MRPPPPHSPQENKFWICDMKTFPISEGSVFYRLRFLQSSISPDTFCKQPCVNLVHNVAFASVIVCSASMNVNFTKEAADFGFNLTVLQFSMFLKISFSFSPFLVPIHIELYNSISKLLLRQHNRQILKVFENYIQLIALSIHIIQTMMKRCFSAQNRTKFLAGLIA